MPITSDEAAEVAQSAGLTLSDAAAIQLLASDLEHARSLAQRFAKPPLADPEGMQEVLDGIPRA